MELLSKRFQLLSKEYGSQIKTIVTDIEETETTSGTRVTITLPLDIVNMKEAVTP
jgi:hypothetical protein